MIRNISLKDFKCFDDETVELRDLTILTGENSSGKSSLIQALLIAINPRRVYEVFEFIGNFDDIKNKYTNPAEIKIDVNKAFQDELKVCMSKERINYSLSEILYKAHYLNANRMGIYSENSSASFSELNTHNPKGEYTISSYEQKKSEQIIKKLQKQEADSFTLDGQLNYWLAYISNLDIMFDTEEINNKIQAFYKIPHIKDRIRPENIGTGISYIAMIITTCLLAKKGEIVIIENPEIHLHPLAQSKLGDFFAFVASCGIQLIIETHNDHIINSICYQQYKQKLNKDQVVIQYKKNIDSHFEKIDIVEGQFYNQKGENRFPEGFFDATLPKLFEING